MPPVLVTLNGLEGHSPVAGLFKCNPSNICAVFYQISTDSALARSLSDSWASCQSVKLHCYGRKTISGKLVAFVFVATMRFCQITLTSCFVMFATAGQKKIAN